jgi:hypothetical protein
VNFNLLNGIATFVAGRKPSPACGAEDFALLVKMDFSLVYFTIIFAEQVGVAVRRCYS